MAGSFRVIALSFALLAAHSVLAAVQNPITRAVAPKPPPASASTNAVPAETVEERLARARSELAAEIAANGESLSNSSPGWSFQQTALPQVLLQRLVRTYEQHIVYVEELRALKERRREIAREAETWTSFSDPKPYSILLLDSLRDSIDAERLEIANGESALAKLRQLAEEQTGLLKEADENIRQLNESLEGGKDTGKLTQQREVERLRSQVAAAMVALLDLERQIREEKLASSRVHLALLERQLVIARAGVTFSNADVEKVLARLDSEQRQMEAELTEAVARRQAAALAHKAAVEKLALTQPQPDGTTAVINSARELVEVRRSQLETADTALTCLQLMLQAATIERSVWEARFASYRSHSPETIRQTEARLKQFRRRVDLWRSYYRQQAENASQKVTLQEERLAGMDTSSILAPLVRERLVTLRESDQHLRRVVRQIERGDRLLQRLEEGLADAAESLPLGSRLENALSDSGSLFSKLWKLELFVAKDTIVVDGQEITGKRSVTLGKILSAVLILVIGYWLTGLISRVIEPLIIKRFKIDVNQANLIRRWFRVVLIFSLAVFSLISVKIPLTVFAFAGGALVIGIGFGTQTLIKNFVSGVIILFERPFRVGDVLDVSGQRGTVVGIGIRSCVLQQWDGTETLIPNSTLLENSVTNWTYTDRKVRFTVTVGVAYGSDTRRVVQLLSEVAERHGLVEKDPTPQILFVNFGESALNFELRFWVNVISANSSQVASDLRQMIAGTLAENGIIIAFPQREIRLDTARPLPIQLIPQSNGEKPGKGAAHVPSNSGAASDPKTKTSDGRPESEAIPKIP